MLPQKVTEEQIRSVVVALENLGIVPINEGQGNGLKENEFFTIMWIEDSTDGMGLTTLTSPTHFKTTEGLARYIVASLIDPGSYSDVEEITDETAEDWVRDNIILENESEEPGHYVVFIDGFSD